MLHLHLTDSPDAPVIAICQQMVELVGQDPYALEALQALNASLTKTAPPTTPEGVRALAQAAMLFPSEGNLRPESFGEWIRLSALACAAGKFDAIPLPVCWPE